MAHDADSHPRPSRRRPASEEHLRLLIESATDYAIFSMDPARVVNTWNVGAERVFGYAENEILGKSGDLIFTDEDRANAEPEKEASTALATGRAADERWHRRKDGTRFFASGVMTPLRAEDGNVIGLVKIARDLTERRLAEERLRALNEELELRVRKRTAELHATNEALRAEIAQRRESEQARQQLLQRLATAQEEERLRISRELHDEIGQHLAALMLGLSSLAPDLRTTAGAAVLRQLQALTETMGREVHALAVQLRPSSLDDFGLLRALGTYLELWSARSGIKAELHATNFEDQRLPPQIELAIYRIVQEGLTNVLKHAAATRVNVILSRTAGEAVAVIEDNGRGFDPDQPASTPRPGIGLLGMQERAAQLNGRMTLESSPGQGTTVFVRLPLS